MTADDARTAADYLSPANRRATKVAKTGDRMTADQPASGSGVESDERPDYATYCPDCGAMFFYPDEGWDRDDCFDCGETNCYEVLG